ncbi:hypothetical protein WR25_18213 [Diploscapter pachys]|uniref:dTDP-4-dehydrorhamnose 3,5-epimerase n=1 Tax=Diploscapter pachys TaxID=2018661 RepID=A0A2A2K7N4_9BILA|nr:hypothetical protein WR25_18213 [Diploscapter pachys]
MNVISTALPDVLIIEPKVFGDSRGFFYESYNARDFALRTGIDTPFVQDNHSRSLHGVLRGLHYQLQNAQGKLVRVLQGDILDVAVDIRRSSPTLGQWVAVRLSATNHRQLSSSAAATARLHWHSRKHCAAWAMCSGSVVTGSTWPDQGNCAPCCARWRPT